MFMHFPDKDHFRADLWWVFQLEYFLKHILRFAGLETTKVSQTKRPAVYRRELIIRSLFDIKETLLNQVLTDFATFKQFSAIHVENLHCSRRMNI
jgi:hypothetical protein